MNEIVFPGGDPCNRRSSTSRRTRRSTTAASAVIGHEMLHGYDDQGSQFDATGNFNNWWTKADRDGFESRTAKLVKQFDDYVAIDGCT